jgi:hypothetical protein
MLQKWALSHMPRFPCLRSDVAQESFWVIHDPWTVHNAQGAGCKEQGKVQNCCTFVLYLGDILDKIMAT